MKIAIYSPYLDTFGGGERYMMTIAELFASDNTVDVLLSEHLEGLGGDYLKNKLSDRFNLDLQSANFIKAPIGKDSSLFARMLFLKKYDILFCLTDGSIFYPTAAKNFLHIQSPLGQPAKSLWGKIKIKGWNLIIYNSQFTKKYSQNNWPLSSQVIYPPVDTDKLKSLKKEKYILSVGRFFGYLKDKKHDVLIKAFKDLYEGRKLTGWSLHLAGAASEGDKKYLQELKRLSEGFPISFYPNIEYDKLIRLYGQSSIYWHAAGFGEDDPTKMEHFGISTVEAMAGGCVPIVINQGGQPEIIENGQNGFLWNSLEELKKLTLVVIQDQYIRSRLSQQAISTSSRFSKRRFGQKIINLLQN